jgi:hypothetical protein
MMLSPYHEYKLPMTPHSAPAGFRGLMADHTVLPFSGNPLAPHYRPYIINPSVAVEHWTHLKSMGVYMNQDCVSDTWILKLTAVRWVHFTFTSELSEDTYILQFVLKIMGQDHGDRTDPCWCGRSF